MIWYTVIMLWYAVAWGFFRAIACVCAAAVLTYMYPGDHWQVSLYLWTVLTVLCVTPSLLAAVAAGVYIGK
jgi:hypothetical protein